MSFSPTSNLFLTNSISLKMTTFSLSAVPVRKCWQRGVYPASWPISVQLGGGLHWCWPRKKPPLSFKRRFRAPMQRGTKSICKQGYNWRLGLMKVFLSCDVNPAGAMADHILPTEASRNVVIDSFNLNIPSGRQRQPAAAILYKTC